MSNSSLRVTISDGTIPLLDTIMERSYGMALESLSVAGSHIQKGARQAFLSKTHNWHQRINKDTGKREVFYDSSKKRRLGYRMSQSTGKNANPKNMSSFITSYLMEKSLTVVVGGKHPRFTPKKRVDGKVTGNLSPVSAVSGHTHSIIHKLNFGERNEKHNWDGQGSMKNFEGANYVARNFMDEGYNMSKNAMIKSMTTRYEKLLHRAVNRADIKVIERKMG